MWRWRQATCDRRNGGGDAQRSNHLIRQIVGLTPELVEEGRCCCCDIRATRSSLSLSTHTHGGGGSPGEGSLTHSSVSVPVPVPVPVQACPRWPRQRSSTSAQPGREEGEGVAIGKLRDRGVRLNLLVPSAPSPPADQRWPRSGLQACLGIASGSGVTSSCRWGTGKGR